MVKLGRKIIIIAGPNGAGKTTFAREFLPKEADCPSFINADLIAAGLSPFAPDRADVRAGRLMLQEIGSYVKSGESFALETTLSGHRYVRMIPIWQQQGYLIKLVFLWLANVEIAIKRVQVRVKQGGHSIPEEIIRRRYQAGWRNFNIYKNIVDVWVLYDNSGARPFLLNAGGNS